MEQYSMLVTDMNNEEFAMCVIEKRSPINLSSSSEMILIQTSWYELACVPESYNVFILLARRPMWIFIIILIMCCSSFLRKDLHRLFPVGEKNMILHTYSGLSHTTRYTLNFLKKRVSIMLPLKNGCPSQQRPLQLISVSGVSLKCTYRSAKFQLSLASILLSKGAKGPALFDHRQSPGYSTSTLQTYLLCS